MEFITQNIYELMDYSKIAGRPRLLNQEQRMKRYEVLSSLLPFFPHLFLIQPLNNHNKYPNDLLNAIYLELSYCSPETQFQQSRQARAAYQQISHYHNQVSTYYQQQEQYYHQNQNEYGQQQHQKQNSYTQYNQTYQPQSKSSAQTQVYSNPHSQQYQEHESPKQQYKNQNKNQNQKYKLKQQPKLQEGYKGKYVEKSNQQKDQPGGRWQNISSDQEAQKQSPLTSKKLEQNTSQSNTSVIQTSEDIVVQYIISTPAPKFKPKSTRLSIEQLRHFVNTSSKRILQTHANPSLVDKVKEVSAWKCQVVELQLRDGPKYGRKQAKRQQVKTNQGSKTEVKNEQNEQAQRLGYKAFQEKKVVILVGTKQTPEARKIKEQLKKRANEFIGQQSAETYCDENQKDRKAIEISLCFITPENLKDIQKDLQPFLYKNEQTCKMLVNQIIRKAWEQPKYITNYAKVCADFSKKTLSEFKFAIKTKKDNPFKIFLVETVQHSFLQNIAKFPSFQSLADKQLFLRELKHKTISNVKFIAQLLLLKVLKRKIIKYCISQLFESFFLQFYAYAKNKQIQDSVYDYQFEAIIEFIQHLGEKYDNMEEKEKDPEQGTQNTDIKAIKDHAQSILGDTACPNRDILAGIDQLTGDQYFELLRFIDAIYIKKAFPQLSLLLKHLIARKNNNWEKAMIDIEDQPEDHKSPNSEEQLAEKVKLLLESWQCGKNGVEGYLKDIFHGHSQQAFYLALLKQLANQTKENVAKRLALLPVIMDYRFNPQEFKPAWTEAIDYFAVSQKEIPYCGAACAKVLICAMERGTKLQQLYCSQNLESQSQFKKEVLHKYYLYSKDEAALKLISAKYSQSMI